MQYVLLSNHLLSATKKEGMEIVELFLNYPKVLLTWPVVFSIMALVFIFQFKEDLKALILRIAKIKLPGRAELTTPQSKRLKEEGKKHLRKLTLNRRIRTFSMD